MAKALKKVLLAAALFALSNSAHAAASAWAFGPAVTISRYQATDSGTGFLGNTDVSAFVFDARLGAMWDNGLFVGGLYRLESGNDWGSANRFLGNALGPSVGYFDAGSGVNVVGSLILFANRTYSAGGVEDKLNGGTGLQIDVGWIPPQMKDWGLGPQLTWRSIRYARSTAGTGVETANAYQLKQLEPMLAAWFKF